MTGENQPARRRVTLTDISSRAWEHPADQGALVALRKLKGFDFVLRKMTAMVNERAFRLRFLGSAIRVDDRQFPDIQRLYAEAAAVLDVRTLPELYVVNSPLWNAVTIGLDKPFIVLNSALVNALDEEELRFVLGHELGHAASGHALYRTLLLWLMQISGALSWVPLGNLGLRAIVAALTEWERKSELSADRAGLLATQDPAAALRVNMKSASGGNLSQLDSTAFLAQGSEYEAAGDLRDSVLKMMLLEASSHPFPVMRAHELRRWVDSGTYVKIIAGDYPRRQDDGSASMSDAARQAAASYGESFRTSQDPLAKLLREIGDGVGSAKDWITSRIPRPKQDDT
ncbi:MULTISPECIES: M48 family metallopeptidase [unclassified Nocardioides]|uniref:M48 family metallopeptidase n=1 Tax=unclassified Nocardioides TaxID=2615069 RepID=UPI0006FD0A06|nr:MULTISPECIES: M48 family metallopeptidase [unclassified Nocardioides]KQY56326.1 peptidase M48 [Nocardioides sp. Root140]KQZ75110.1 peptidase M48 [Nocardioides sp. Root151]KRF14188.1 peptidase M48 [Nocardioides sp. Soil796]